MSRDPIEESGGVNLYGFVYNNPQSWYDDLGHKPGTSDKSKWRRDIDKRRRQQAQDRHRNRNEKNKCPEDMPDGECPNKGETGWKDEGRPKLHGGKRTFRGTGENSGSQCTYDEDGKLDDESENMGTYDYNDPYGGDGEFDFPSDVGNLIGHVVNDVLPHLSDNNYTPNLTNRHGSK